MQVSRYRPRCRGMSLVELLLVMAILSVVMLAVTSLFIPAQRATVVQSQVSDIQSNLRLAMNRLSQDLLVAGFLATGDPIIFEGSVTPTTAENPDPDDFTIRTRLAGSGFGRAGNNPGPTANPDVVLTSPDMYQHFPVGTKVRLFNPVAMRELDDSYDETTASAADKADHVYTVTVNDGTKLSLNTNGISVDVDPETVVVAVRDTSQPPLQTIRYQFADSNGDGTPDALLRIVNGNTQFLARNVSDAVFAYSFTTEGKVQRVDITLEGETRALAADDAIAGAKTRSLQSSVTLRNVF